MDIQLYDSNLVKAEWPLDAAYRVIDRNCDVSAPGTPCVLVTSQKDEKLIYKCRKLRHMTFEINKVCDSSPNDSVYYCSVHVLCYEHGTEYPPDAEHTIVAGRFINAYPEAVYNALGYWDVGKTGAIYFFVTEYTQELSCADNSTSKYLSFILKGTRTSKKVIDKLIERYHEDVFSLTADTDGLSLIIRDRTKREALCERLGAEQQSRQLIHLLTQFRVRTEVALSVAKFFGDGCYARILQNPFLLHNYDKITIEQVNRIAASLPGNDYMSFNNLNGLIFRYLAERRSRFGDLYVPRSDFIHSGDSADEPSLFERFYDLYRRHPHFTDTMINTALDNLIGSNRLSTEQEPDVVAIYNPAYLTMENQISCRLLDMAARKPEGASGAVANAYALCESMKNDGIVLDDKQKAAVRMALSNSISIISGGPGTGKTMITKLIVNAFERTYPNKTIQLCAPTGKACARMTDVIGREACTIHRKLGFGVGQIQPIAEDLLILDECSMIDIELFSQVLKAASPNTSIVLIGDYNQLPSVGPGLVLRDLIDSHVIPTTVLTGVFRQKEGSEIIKSANAILNNNPSGVCRASGQDFSFVDKISEREMSAYIAGLLTQLVHVEHKSPEDIQILTPQNQGMLGTVALNALARNICNPGCETKPRCLVAGQYFCVGDRVIQTENNYKLGVFNGTIGHIVGVDAEGVNIDFAGIVVRFDICDMSSIKLGYAISVHRSQGSEFDTVIMPVTANHVYSLSRNLLYTAVSRAKGACVLVGQYDAFLGALNRDASTERRSLLSRRLRRGCLPSASGCVSAV